MGLNTLSIRPEEALRERVWREYGRRHLVDFSEYISPWYHPARHHRLVGKSLEKVELYIRTKGAEGIGRLLIFEPPRHGKSEQASKHFPAWVLGRNPDARVILASYGADLAVLNSRKVREIVDGERYRALFGDLAGEIGRGSTQINADKDQKVAVELSEDSRSAEAWDLASPHRGGLTAAGVGGGITGKGANLLVIDDPFKNRDEAESHAHRERVWNWWTSSAYTRLEVGGAVVGMLTRWHGDDWAGRLIKAMATDPKADQYEVVYLPAVWEEVEAPKGLSFDEFKRQQRLEGIWIEEKDLLGRKPGQALWEEKYDEGDLERIKANVGPYDWEALYQQQPYLRIGGFFKREWFAVIEEGPGAKVVARIRYWDKAGTTKGDYSAGVLMSMTEGGTIYVEHMERGQWTPGEREEKILATAKLDAKRPGPRVIIWHQKDPGSAGLDSAQATNQKLAKEGFAAYYEDVTGDKEVRAGPWSSMCQGGGVRLVRGGWNAAYVEEHVGFPKGKYDDQVDNSAGAFTKLTNGLITGQLFF